VQLYVGTSGFSYDGWVGPFYPADLPAGDRLAYYATRLSAVEINNSFYRIPTTEVVEGWAESVPPAFRIVLKVSRRVTHFGRLGETAEEPMQWMLRAAEALGERRGPLLCQLPPNLRADPARLAAFLGRLPPGAEVAFEFRHASWQTPEVADVLRAHGAALCLSDEHEPLPAELPRTAPFGYLRLRRAEYAPADLDRAAAAVRAAAWERAFVFFKHEDAGVGPALAADFRTRFPAQA
jgi:uncharacterized protein YecE (DUF72 family)